MWLSPGKKVCKSLINYFIKGISTHSRVHYLKWVVLWEECLNCENPKEMPSASLYDHTGGQL